VTLVSCGVTPPAYRVTLRTRHVTLLPPRVTLFRRHVTLFASRVTLRVTPHVDNRAMNEVLP
jgi:hypothetical protein